MFLCILDRILNHGAMPVPPFLNNLAGLNAVVSAKGGVLVYLNEINALNNIDIIETGAGGYLNVLSALNSIDVLLGGSGGYLNELDALNSIVVLEGGAGGHLNTIDAINEWVDNSGGESYIEKVLSFGPLAYWPMNETSGTNADNAEGTSARDGTFSGVTLNSIVGPDGEPAGLWDGVNDFCDIYSASLDGAWTPEELTIAIWMRVRAASVWTDGVARTLMTLYSNVFNRITFRKEAAGNSLLFQYEAANVNKFFVHTISNTLWFNTAMTISLSNDRVKCFIDGLEVQELTSIGTWAGALSAANTIVGAFSTAPLNITDGYLAHSVVINGELTPAQVLDLATI